MVTRRTVKTDDVKPDDPPTDDDAKPDDPPDPKGSVKVDPDQLDSAVERAIARVFGGRKPDEAKADDDVKPDDDKPAGRRTLRDEEDATEDKVRAALAKVRDEEAKDERLDRLEKIVEKPPQHVRRLTKALWGTPDE